MKNKLALSLILLRISVALVMLMWALDKIINPDHAAGVFQAFYGIETGAAFLTAIAVVQIAIIAAFAAGIAKTVTYGLVLLMHAGSTFASWKQYMAPFDNLLFFAAWPMLAACVALFLLRREDSFLSAGR